ncbi:hypothetical protein [Anabaena subtropica]|nr:hypothetical protein [Anabaena subtropica]
MNSNFYQEDNKKVLQVEVEDVSGLEDVLGDAYDSLNLAKSTD